MTEKASDAATALAGPPCVALPPARPLVMGIVNVTPDSFSDGGVHFDAGTAIESGLAMVRAGADILDVGGESTRPGAELVPETAERARVLPVIAGLSAAGCPVPISIDTRKAAVASEALTAGARLFNDVTALTFDPESLAVARRYADAGGAVCLMHAQGDPKTMQDAPFYEDVVRDVCAFLTERIAVCAEAGIPAHRLITDPGIGFGKTQAHNLALIRGLGTLRDLGPPVLLGVSRKGFIGRIGDAPAAAERFPGSIAAGLFGLAQGAQILRVHDVAETVQAVKLWNALSEEAV
ncbi:MAG: dihydropteroate synthase [Pseudomonadota bacterium]